MLTFHLHRRAVVSQRPGGHDCKSHVTGFLLRAQRPLTCPKETAGVNELTSQVSAIWSIWSAGRRNHCSGLDCVRKGTYRWWVTGCTACPRRKRVYHETVYCRFPALLICPNPLGQKANCCTGSKYFPIFKLKSWNLHYEEKQAFRLNAPKTP